MSQPINYDNQSWLLDGRNPSENVFLRRVTPRENQGDTAALHSDQTRRPVPSEMRCQTTGLTSVGLR